MSVSSTESITFLFTDIEGSTRLWYQQPEQMRVALARHDAVLRGTIRSHGGEVFKTIGDAFCVAFGTPQAAVRAAIDAQTMLHREVPTLRVRMAAHTGEAQAREGDYFGPALNHVARLLAAGHGRQVLLSRATAERVRDRLPDGAGLRPLGMHELRDIPARESIFQLQAQDEPARFPPLNTLDVAFRRGLLRATALAAVVLAVIGALALLAARNARIARLEATRAQRLATDLRRNLYAADLNLAQQALAEENQDQALKLLDAYRPAPRLEDLRTFEWRYLWNERRDRSHWTLAGSYGGAGCADYSPDGKVLAVAWSDRTVRFYDAANRKELAPLPPFESAPRYLAFAPDGATLAVHCTSGNVVVCDLATRRAINTFPGDYSDSGSLAFSADGRLLAAPEQGGRIQVWDLRARRAAVSVPGTALVAFSPLAPFLATRGPAVGNEIRLRDLSSQEERILVTGDYVTSLAFSRDGRRLAAGLESGALRLWEVASGRSLPAPRGHRAWVYSVAFSPDDRQLATASTDSTVRLWDLATGREIAHLRGHRHEVITIRFSPDGRTLASACSDGTVKLWDVASATADEYPTGDSLVLSPGGSRLAVKRAGDRAIVLWDLTARRELGRLDPGGAGAIPLAFSPHGDALYTAATGGPETPSRRVTIWNVEARRAVGFISTPDSSPRWPSLSPDGRFLVLANPVLHRSLALLDLATRRCVPSVRGNLAAFSADSRFLATGESSDGVRIYDTGSWRVVARVRDASVGPMEFSPDGRWLAIGGYDQLWVWDTRSWKAIVAFQAHSGKIEAVRFSPDGRTLATAGNAPTVKLWNTRMWRPSLAFEHPGRHPDTLRFTTDGDALATIGGGTLRFWRAAPLR